jgi:hypothetical protein
MHGARGVKHQDKRIQFASPNRAQRDRAAGCCEAAHADESRHEA